MTKNNYLNICPINLITKHEDNFKGIIKPKNYSSWLEYDPFVMLLEGIHQFCVKISLLSDPPLHYQSGLRIPGQIKKLTLKQQPDYLDHHICGNCLVLNNIYLVTFTVATLSATLVAEGQVYVATVTST